MANLRIVEVTAISSNNLIARFTESLASDITIDNIEIVSDNVSVPDSAVLSVKVSKNALDIICQPLTPNNSYKVIFKSTLLVSFRNVNSTSFLFEDGKSNAAYVIGQEDSSNIILQNLNNLLHNQIYKLEDGSLVSKLVRMFATYFIKSLYDLKQVKNENYLSKTIVDEKKTRGTGPFDRLAEEGAYEILRVGKTKTTFKASTAISYAEFPNHLVSLRQTDVADEEVELRSTDVEGGFNITNFTFTLSKKPVIKVTKVMFFYSAALPFEYPVSTLGYQIKEDKYDPNHGFKYLLLEDNQFRISEKALEDAGFSLENISKITVSYQYKNTGRIINPDSVVISKTFAVSREVVEPLKNIFNLKGAPIVNGLGAVPVTDGALFLDPNAFPSLTKDHPAFATELTYSLEALPTKPGEYAVDYSAGTVYVFGENYKNEGTGAYPPLVSYDYRLEFRSLVDFVYDSDEGDIAPLVNGNLIGTDVRIEFDFQDTMVDGIDFSARVHEEVLTERVENRYLPTFSAITVKRTPITNVFRIFNESKGVVYNAERWSNDKVYFRTTNPPAITTINGERVSFQMVLNDLLFVNEILENSSTVRVFKILLSNNNIISSTEDCIAASFNTSLTLSNGNIFIKELYFNSEFTEAQSIDRLNNVGDYTVDYQNGILYCAVDADQNFDLGTASYKRSHINPTNSHVLNPVSIYYRRNVLQPKDKEFDYTSFGEGSILPSTFDLADERHLTADDTSVYLVISGDVGAYVSGDFITGVANNINYIRGLYEYTDLLNNDSPINFADAATSDEKSITLAAQEHSSVQVVEQDGYVFYVNTNLDLDYLSPNISVNVMVTRLSDSETLWDGTGTYTLGKPVRLTLPGINSTTVGDHVSVTISLEINNTSRVVVDYNKGDYYVDYTYLADEIVISYEYGENQLDFREFNTLDEGDEYYVTYRVGALRDALLKNFGSLIDIPILNVFDSTFERERYRESLIAAMSSFVQGPTISAMKRIVSTITHVDPEIVETIFENWSLGNSFLYPMGVTTTGNPKFLKGKYGMGVLLDKSEQTISFPASSNLRLEQGTFETWIIPQWAGLDNNAKLTFTVKKNDSFINEVDVFIGAGEYHPTYKEDASGNSYFEVAKVDKKSPIGKPNKNKPGVYIYIDKDGYTDGYVDGYVSEAYSDIYRWYVDVINPDQLDFSLLINSNGNYFDIKSIGPKLSETKITSGTNQIRFEMEGAQQGLTFVSDVNHYILDAPLSGEGSKNRISIFKDVAGYLNLKIVDKDKSVYSISADVSDWHQNEKHHVAASWALNSKNERDELHLFVDGQEVPNIVRYGDRIPTAYGRKFRTINPEEILTRITSSIVAGKDLITEAGSASVTSAINFGAEGIVAGDTLYIEESGFNTSGYTILAVGGNTLTLDTTMPLSIEDGVFSVNKLTLPVSTRLEAYPNIAVYAMKPYYTANDGYTSIDSTLTSSSTNFSIVDVEVGDFARLTGTSDFASHYIVTDVTPSSITFNREIPTETGVTFNLYKPLEEELPGPRAIFPYYQFSKTGSQSNLVLRNGVGIGDLVLIKSLGMNFKRVRSNYYVWSDTSNTIQTRLPAPLSLDDVLIHKIILAPTNVGPSNTDGYIDGYYAAAITTDQPIVSDTGRTLSVTVAASNVDYTLGPVTIEIYGNILGIETAETLVFDVNGIKDTLNKFKTISSVRAYGTPIDPTKNFFVLSIKETYPITTVESSATYPVLRFSYQVRYSNTLVGDGSTTVSDNSGTFSTIDVGNYVHVFSPPAAVGYYQIISVSEDHKSCVIDSALPAFTDGSYEVLNVTTYRSGLQNGYFMFEDADIPGKPYLLTKGGYSFDYDSYIAVKFEPIVGQCFVGSDFQGHGQANAILDEIVIRSNMLTDIRVGETAAKNTSYITKDYNALKESDADSSMLILLHCEDGKVTNAADYYVTTTRGYVQAGHSVNDNFKQSIALKDSVFTVPNSGILSTHSDGTIEFWVNPMVDTANDPNYRFYFDASSVVTEEVTSINNSTVKISGRAGRLLGVKLKHGDRRNYSSFGTVGSDKQTIRLKQQLPHQETPVVVTYVPSGVSGDRISIYKDPYGQLAFNVTASGKDYQIRCPVFWIKNSWHRVKATFKFNGGKKLDEIRLFVDGFERGNVLFGSGLLFGENLIFGQAFVGRSKLITTIKFTDVINQFSIGTDYNGNYSAHCLIDNLRISNVSRPGYVAFGEAIDVSYNNNTDVAIPVTKDLYTTYLLDFDLLKHVNNDFALLKSKNFGQFDFSVNIIDSFAILKNSGKVKEVLETLINTLKPANSRVFITYE